MAMQVLLSTNIEDVTPKGEFRLEAYLHVFSRHCVTMVVLSEREMVRMINTRENILEMVQRSPRLSTHRMASHIGVSRMQVWRTLHEDDLYPYHDQRVHLEPGDHAQRTLNQVLYFS